MNADNRYHLQNSREITVKYSLLITTFIVCSSAFSVMADNEKTNRDWHFAGSVLYTSRTLDGTIMNKIESDSGAFGDFITTGDAMDVGSSEGAMLALAVQYKRFGIGINYMPTSFRGQGEALVGVSGSNSGLFQMTTLDTEVDVDMLLASAYYNVIQTPETVFGVGFGFGQTTIDLNIVPEVGNSMIYNGVQPFGFLNVHMLNNYKGFLYGFALNGLAADIDGASVDYSDYKFDLGYRLTDAEYKVDLVGGYRLVNFAIDLEYEGNTTATAVSLEGPFIGASVRY